MYRLASISLFLCLSGLSLFSQRTLDFDNLSMDDGFTSSKANTIIQDRQGFIWIGTWNGLNRYDGYECIIFRPSYHDTTGISNREVLALLEDHAGNIWIGTTSGLNCLDPRTTELKRYDFQHRIISLFEDDSHDIWVGTWNGGLYRLNPDSGERENYFPTDIVSDIHEDSRNNLWVATYNGLVNFDRNTSGYVRYYPDQNNPRASISHSIITQIVESSDGKLWIGTWGGGLNRVVVHPNKDSLQFEHYRSGEEPGSLSSDVIYRLYYDDYGNIWSGTWDAGLNLLDPVQQSRSPGEAVFQKYMSDLTDPYSISGNNITALYVDRSGVLWVGSSKIDRTDILNSGLTRIKTTRIEDGVIMASSVRSFAAQDNLLWAGTTNELKLYTCNEGQCKIIRNIPQITYRMGNTSYTSNSVMSIMVNNDGLWAGTEDAGLILFPGRSAIEDKDPKFIFFNNATQLALPGNKVCNIVESVKYPGVLWIGTMQNGFAKFKYNSGQPVVEILNVGHDANSISDHNIRSVLEDRDGMVWIGTQNGLNRYNPADHIVTKFFYSMTDTNTLNDNVINVIYEDVSGNLWIGTNSGLNKKQILTRPDGTEKIYFKGYPHHENLDNEIITNILEDDSQHIWIGLYRGMVKFNEVSETVIKEFFTREYQNVIIERNSAIKDGYGMFFLGGGNGFISFYPDSLLKYSIPPRVCITDLLISNKSITENTTRDGKKYSICALPYRESIELTSKDRVLTFVFSAMDFKATKKNEYAYFLEGFDNSWNEVGARNSATYTNIPPGEYVFKVKAANSDGIWSEKPGSISLSIAPPWWRTTAAYIIYALILIGLLYFFNQFTLIRVREKGRIAIEHMQYEKEHEITELKSHFFTNITHEFRTPLTLIMGPVEELLKIKELPGYALKQAELIQRNAQRLLRLVNQMMELRTVERGKMEIHPEKCDVAAILNDIYDSFKSMADSKDLAFSLKLKSPEINAVLDTEKFEKVMFNLVANAFKFSEEGGTIVIRAGIEDHDGLNASLIIEVEDTGIGIAEEHLESVFERFFQAYTKHTQSTGGIGLFLSRAFIELHGGEIKLESEPGKGSCFKVIIPQEKDALQFNIEEPELIEQVPGTGADAGILQAGEILNESRQIFTSSRINSSVQVLVVEDDSELNEFMVSGLSPDFKVVGAYNGQEGLEVARKMNPDIIITDIMMPVLDGIELCKMLRKDLATSHIPIIFLTAKTMPEDEIKGLEIGAVDYIYKPFNLVSVKLKIQNILDNRARIHDKIRTDQIMQPAYIELTSLDENFLKDAVDAVNKHLDDPTFDVEKFSREIGISANQAYRKLKALTGQTAKEFIRNQRLKTSANLLLQKKRSISEIIYMVGFSTPSYFTRCFKENYGCTPKEFIERGGKVEV
jgi:signal transduction histidine kinase/ligand-binding sensor domain-containing protein/DNA-binding response OmpR family regulator